MTSSTSDFSTPEGHYDWETRHYLHYAKSWRDVPEAVDRRGAGQVHRRRADVVLAVRPDRRGRQRRVLRPRAVHGHLRRRAARPHLGVRAPQGQGAAVHRGLDHRGARPSSSAWSTRSSRSTSWCPPPWRWPDRSPRRMPSRCAWPSGRSTTPSTSRATRTAIDSCFDMHHFGHTRARVVTGGMPALSRPVVDEGEGQGGDEPRRDVRRSSPAVPAASARRPFAGWWRSACGVAVFDRDGDRADELAKELGDDAVAVGGDVNDDDDVAAAIEAARSLGPLSVLVNVAGGGVGGGRTVGRGGTPHDKELVRRDHGDERDRDLQRDSPGGRGHGRRTSPTTTASAASW